MLDNTQSIICAFGLAAAAPRSPYRHLELCGIALKSKSPLDALVSIWENSVCTAHHFLSDAEILKIKTYIPQVVAHHVDAHFLHELLVVNIQYRLAAEHLRFKGKIRILRAGIFGTAEAVLNVSCSLL